MAFYDALIAKWATLSSTTIDAKLAEINSTSVTGAIPTSIMVNGNQILNAIVYSEFKALPASQESNLLALLNCPDQLLGGSANTGHMLVGMILDYFGSSSVTIANLTALSKGLSQPWWQANGYFGPINGQNVVEAGLS